MGNNNIYMTNRHCYSLSEAQEILRHELSERNWSTLISNITDSYSASRIDGFTEIDGILFLLMDDDLIGAALNLSNPDVCLLEF